MASSINNNIPSLKVDTQINARLKQVQKSFDHLSSGKRITSAADDAAGLAIAVQLSSNADTSSVAARNISDGVSAASIADAAVSSASDITGRLSELATQASNGVLSADQRTQLNNEYQQLSSELDRISQTTEFNGQKLLSQDSTVTVQAGIDGSPNSQVNLGLPGVSAKGLGLTADLTTAEGAKQALEQSKQATTTLAEARGDIGSGLSKLGVAFENLKTSEVNSREAASRISDADVGAESATLAANNIGLQAALAVKAHASLTPESVLKLLA